MKSKFIQNKLARFKAERITLTEADRHGIEAAEQYAKRLKYEYGKIPHATKEDLDRIRKMAKLSSGDPSRYPVMHEAPDIEPTSNE